MEVISVGQSAADFGAVPTKGLVDRALRKIEKAHAELDRIPLITRKRRLERHKELGLMQAEILAGFATTVGTAMEPAFRARLIRVLDPRIKAGSKRMTFRM